MSPACNVGGAASQKLPVMRNLTTEQWERATDVPLMVAAAAFLAAYAIPILKPDRPAGPRRCASVQRQPPGHFSSSTTWFGCGSHRIGGRSTQTCA